MEPYLTVLNSLPKVALGPIIIILCGANIKSIIIMALLISLIITISNVYSDIIQYIMPTDISASTRQLNPEEKKAYDILQGFCSALFFQQEKF